MLEAIREQLLLLHAELPRHGLVAWTGGNISARDPETGLVAIKPSGVRYEELTADSMVVLHLDGQVVDGRHKPSSDVASHLYIYRHRPDVNGVVHTHSRYATAFAAVGRPIPVYLTAQADEFGGEIPCAGFAMIGDEAIGAQVVESIGRSPAVLLKNHGVFTIGPTARAAVKSAVMTEDIAATV
jgi:L-ribulose-5-phosphate 4-epimerase